MLEMYTNSRTSITQEYDEDYVANSYSKYRSYDMKYESRTNSFEDYFVSAVKSCNSNLDDGKKRDIEQKHKVL